VGHENEYMHIKVLALLCIAAVIFTILFDKSATINVFQYDFFNFIMLLLAHILKAWGHVTPGLILSKYYLQTATTFF